MDVLAADGEQVDSVTSPAKLSDVHEILQAAQLSIAICIN